MLNRCRHRALAAGLLMLVASTAAAQTTVAAEVTINGALQGNAMTIPDPKPEDHIWVIFAVDGSPEIAARVKKVMDESYPENGLDAAAAIKFQQRVNSDLKFFVAPDSTALKPQDPKAYDGAARGVALTGTIYDQDGKHWIRATALKDVRLKYPEKMLAADKPFIMPDKDPLVLEIAPGLKLNCIRIPLGKAVLGAPFYMANRYQEEYPRLVTLTKSCYMGEIPITQEMWEAAMGNNPSKLKGATLPVENPPFAEVDKFCQIISAKTHRNVRLPTAAEWEYAARVGTSNPGFNTKYADQNSEGNDGFNVVLPVKSKKPNAWSLYDMASCWWDITGDKAMYPVRHEEVDPKYPVRSASETRCTMGVPHDHWDISIREFNDEKGLGYSNNKFRIVVDVEDAGQ